jgi:hypothetical protein
MNAQPAPRLTLVKTDPDSLLAAKAANWAERRAVEQATGVRILDDGAIALVVGECPICGYQIGASTAQTAETKLHAHLAVKHPAKEIA